MKRRNLKGMSVATAFSGRHYSRHSVSACDNACHINWRYTMSYQRCTYCGSQLHTVANCPKTWGGSSRRANLRCGYCGGQGHTSSACPSNASSARRRALNDDFYLD